MFNLSLFLILIVKSFVKTVPDDDYHIGRDARLVQYGKVIWARVMEMY